MPASTERRRHPSLERHLELAAGAHVDAEPFLLHPAQHAAAAERLGRVEHAGIGAEGVVEVPAPAAEVFLVEGEQRGAELPGQLASVHAAQHERAVAAPGRARPDGRIQGIDIGGRRGRMIGRQHVGVPGACGMGDSAHDSPWAAARRGRMLGRQAIAGT
jgi:hypothetical protein